MSKFIFLCGEPQNRRFKDNLCKLFPKNICLMSYFIKSSIPGSLNTHCVFKLFCVVLNKQTNLSSISTAILVLILYLLTSLLSCYTFLLLLLLFLHFSMRTCLLFSALSKDHTSMRTRSQKKKLSHPAGLGNSLMHLRCRC